MKTVFDAVNDLKGDLQNTKPFGSGSFVCVCISNKSDAVVGDYALTGGIHCTDSWREVCTVDEFNQCVAEMSAWQPTLKGDDVKTVTVDGMVYEIGKIYEFSDDGKEWEVFRLVDADEEGVYKFDVGRDVWRMCRELNEQLGTITPAPVELKNGQIYMFDIGVTVSEVIGRYYVAVTGEKMFDLVGNNRFVKVSDCTNITRLIPEAK